MAVSPARSFAPILAGLLLALPASAGDDDPEQAFRLPRVEVLENFSISFEAGTAWEETSEVGIGTVIVGFDDYALARTDGRVLTTRLGGDLSYAWGETSFAQNLRTRFRFDTSWGSEVDTAEEPDFGNNVAIVYYENAPSGMTSLFLGNSGLQASSKVSLDVTDLRLETAADFDVCDAADVTLSPNLGLLYGDREQRYQGAAVSILDAGINSLTDQTIEDRYYGVGFGLGASYQLTPSVGFFADASLDLFYRDTEFDSVQSNQCLNVGCNPMDTNFDVVLSQDESGFAWGSRLDVGTQLSCDRLDVQIGLGLDYRSAMGELFDPVSPPGANYQFLGEKSNVAPCAFIQLTYNF